MGTHVGAPRPPSVSDSKDTDQCKLTPLIVCNVLVPLNQSDVFNFRGFKGLSHIDQETWGTVLPSQQKGISGCWALCGVILTLVLSPPEPN